MLPNYKQRRTDEPEPDKVFWTPIILLCVSLRSLRYCSREKYLTQRSQRYAEIAEKNSKSRQGRWEGAEKEIFEEEFLEEEIGAEWV